MFTVFLTSKAGDQGRGLPERRGPYIHPSFSGPPGGGGYPEAFQMPLEGGNQCGQALLLTRGIGKWPLGGGDSSGESIIPGLSDQPRTSC